MSTADIDPFTAERILDAAARGETVDGFEGLGELFGALHAPGSAAELAGPLPAPPVAPALPRRDIGRLTRRTAVAAGAAVFALSGVAAAFTGGGTALEPFFDSDDPPPAEAPDADPPVATADENLPLATTDVDPSDGLDDDELGVLCEAAENHGDYVSPVAQDKVGNDTDGNHGDRASDAAQSECGETEADVDASAGLDEGERAELCETAEDHGDYVSPVAQDKVGDDTDGDHGDRVSDAAQSDCGKHVESGGTTEANASADHDDDDDDDDDDGSKPERDEDKDGKDGKDQDEDENDDENDDE